jgi:hypothetical protein
VVVAEVHHGALALCQERAPEAFGGGFAERSDGQSEALAAGAFGLEDLRLTSLSPNRAACSSSRTSSS